MYVPKGYAFGDDGFRQLEYLYKTLDVSTNIIIGPQGWMVLNSKYVYSTTKFEYN